MKAYTNMCLYYRWKWRKPGFDYSLRFRLAYRRKPNVLIQIMNTVHCFLNTTTTLFNTVTRISIDIDLFVVLQALRGTIEIAWYRKVCVISVVHNKALNTIKVNMEIGKLNDRTNRLYLPRTSLVVFVFAWIIVWWCNLVWLVWVKVNVSA